jgi:dipeptidyl-peptidase-4
MKKLLFVFLLLNIAYAQNKKEITLEDIFKKSTFVAKERQGLRSLKDGKTYVSIEKDSITGQQYVARNRYEDGRMVDVLFREVDLKFKDSLLPISTDLSEDESKVLLSKDEEPIYRHSFRANYFVYDLKSKRVMEVSTGGKQMYGTLSPDGTKVAFVRDNNLFITDLIMGNEYQITHDGLLNHIINGGADWVYEEEFSFARAFFWSPDSKKIAYYRFDESEVPEFDLAVYDKLYPTTYRYKYPKAGESNSMVRIQVYDLSSQVTQIMDIGSNTDQYIPRIKWTAVPNSLCILRMNRHQNKLDYLLADIATGQTKVILTRESKQYLDINDDLTFLRNKNQFVLTSDSDGYNHLYLYGMDGKLIQQITKGSWEITQLYGIDEKTGRVYYQSTENSPLRRDVYEIQLDGSHKKRLSTTEGTTSATFSNDFSYYILNQSDHSTPPHSALYMRSGKLIRMLEDNWALQKLISDYLLSPTELFEMTTSTGVTLNGYMIRPADFDASKKYPVLMYVYGGPGSQQVVDSWSGARNLWFNYLAQKGYIIACVDNRGTGFRGSAFKKETYKELGKYETIDQIEVAKWLAQKNYVDPARIGIWGWSFGGYLSSLCITKGADVFSMAIAVAPVTSWRYYDSIYTERYLQTPQENPVGYDENSPIHFADKLKGKFLLVHGTADDNVHFQNSVLFSEALIQANKSFEQAYYPNKNHGIYGGNTRLHLYQKMTDFILRNL